MDGMEGEGGAVGGERKGSGEWGVERSEPAGDVRSVGVKSVSPVEEAVEEKG